MQTSGICKYLGGVNTFFIFLNWNYVACLTIEIIIKTLRPLSTIYSLRMKIYHLVCFLLAAAEVITISRLGGFGFSNLSVCLVEENTDGVYVLAVIYLVNVPMLWVNAFIVLLNPVSRKNKQIKHMVIVSITKTITWGIPTLCVLVPTDPDFDYLALLLGVCSGMAVCFSRLGVKHSFKIFYQICLKRNRSEGKKIINDSLIVNEYIKDELSIANLLENLEKDTAKSILIGISLIFLTEFSPKSENSYTYSKKKYLFNEDHFKILESTIGKNVYSESSSFEIWEYESDIFKSIREMYGWSDIVIINAFCDRENFRNLENTNRGGRSSAFIFRTQNDQLIIKTITKEEKYLLIDILGKYHNRIVNHRESRIVRILGLYKIRSSKQSFIIMENLLKYKKEALIFDLKGSLYERRTPTVGNEYGIVLKDQNFIEMNIRIHLNSCERDKIIKAIREDAEFLQELDIIDYSLVIGLYNQKIKFADNYSLEGKNQELYSLGIIDFLQQYTLSKKLELAYKKLKCKTNLSVCPSHEYTERFINFIFRLFNNE